MANMHREYRGELRNIVDLLKAGNSIAESSVSGKLKSSLESIKPLIVIGVVKILRKLNDDTRREDLISWNYAIIKDTDSVDLESEIDGIEKALQSLKILIDNGYIDSDNEEVDKVILNLWRSAWVATCLFCHTAPELTPADMSMLLYELWP